MTEPLTNATLRIHTTTTTPADLTRILDIVPNEIFDKGSFLRKGTSAGPVRSQSIWILNGTVADIESIENHIVQLVEFLESKRDLLAELSSDIDIDMLVSQKNASGQGNVTLSTDLLKRIAELNSDLMISFYMY